MSGDLVLAERPVPGTPRPYAFPDVAEHRLDNGLRILVADLPGRPLISASLVLGNGAADEPPAEAGATVLAARALSGTARSSRTRSAHFRRRDRMTFSDSTRTEKAMAK